MLQSVAEKMNKDKRYEVTPEIEALEQKYSCDVGARRAASLPEADIAISVSALE